MARPLDKQIQSFIRDIFGRDQKAKEDLSISSRELAAGGSSHMRLYGAIESDSLGGVTDALSLNNKILERYADYEEMDEYGDINSALDIYADDVTQVDSSTGKSIWINSNSDAVKKDLEDVFYNRLKADEIVWEIARQVCKYGNDFEEIVVGADGVVGLNFLPPATVRRIEGTRGDLKGFLQSYTTDLNIEPAMFDKMKMQGGGAVNGQKNIALFEDWRVTHFRLRSKNRDSVYGWAVTDPARWAWRRLILLEDAVMVYKLCLRGDSKIWTTDGVKNIKDLEEGDEVYSYTVQDRFIKAKVNYKKHNGRDKIFEVKSKNRSLYANKTHPVLVETIIKNGKGNSRTRNVEYVEVENLVPGVHRLITPIKEDYLAEEILFKYPEVGYKARLSEKSEARINRSIKKLQKECGMNANLIKRFFNKDYEVVLHTAQKLMKENGYDDSELIIRENWGGVNRVNLPEHIDENFSRWFGFMIGDGSISERPFEKNGKQYFVREVCFAAGDRDEINQKYFKIFNDMFDGVKFVRDKRNENECVGKYYVVSKQLHDFMLLNGFIKGAYNKRIPEWVFKSKLSVRLAFLEGLADADGHVKEATVSSERNRVSYKRVSLELCNRELCNDVRELCMQCGLTVTAVNKRTRKGGRVLDGHVLSDYDSYCVKWSYERQPMTQMIDSVTEIETDDIWDIGVDSDEHNFVANGVVVHNTRSPSRYAFYVDVGTQPNREAEKTLLQVKQKLKKRKFVNPKTGKLDFRFNPLSFDEDFFLGVRDGKETTRIDVLNGPSYQQVDDVQYFLYKLYAALKVPRAYLGYDENMPSKATLSQEDVRFARTTLRIQREIRNGFHKVGRVHLASRRIDPASVEFDVAMTVPSSIFEMGQLEVKRTRADIATSMERHVSLYWLLSNIYGMSDEDIKAVMQQKQDEMKKAQSMGAGGGSPFESRIMGHGSLYTSEKALMEGNREHEKRMEEHLKKHINDSNSRLGKQLREVQMLLHELAASRKKIR